MTSISSRKTFFWLLSGLFLVAWTLLAFGVHDRSDWLLENVLVFVLVGPIIYQYIKGTFSKTAFFLAVLFTVLHVVGSHYTYSLVPYDIWSEDLFGISINKVLGWKRNNYDRLIHFLWGLLLYLPIWEYLAFRTSLKGRWPAIGAVGVVMATSSFYEMLEGLAAGVFAGDLGAAYLGTQGDQFDAQKDEALALLGALIAVALFYRKVRAKRPARYAFS